MLTTDAFNEVLATMPSVDRKLLTVLAQRLREVEEQYMSATHQVVNLHTV